MFNGLELAWIDDNQDLIEKRDFDGLLVELSEPRITFKTKMAILLAYLFWGNGGFKMVVSYKGPSKSERRRERGEERFHFTVYTRNNKGEYSNRLINFRGTLAKQSVEGLVKDAVLKWIRKTTGKPFTELVNYLCEDAKLSEIK